MEVRIKKLGELEAEMRAVARGDIAAPADAAIASAESEGVLPDDDGSQGDWRTPEQRAHDIAQAEALRQQASKGGLRFEVFLPPGLAEWILDLVAQGAFTDPSEAVFVMLGEQQDLEPHNDLRQEILRRSLQEAMDDPDPGISGEEMQERMRKRLAEPRPEPAIWRKHISP